ncbi:hypothetical protein GOP47_0012193 [Adiantum capillus-veneris]|uniref:Uncharacterized protein n=1 Tax=Adiantum capillus-veneris TaxID=13818 RepID=A0A9D4UR94_ADICA|nr:hypothetical protein GOP47_0012193 [Adiantum capillus-veneris]
MMRKNHLRALPHKIKHQANSTTCCDQLEHVLTISKESSEVKIFNALAAGEVEGGAVMGMVDNKLTTLVRR